MTTKEWWPSIAACDMAHDCNRAVTHVDTRGFIYCAHHAAIRSACGDRCRKLTAKELRMILASAQRAAAEHDATEPHGEHITLRGSSVEVDAALVERITLAESDPWSAGQ